MGKIKIPPYYVKLQLAFTFLVVSDSTASWLQNVSGNIRNGKMCMRMHND